MPWCKLRPESKPQTTPQVYREIEGFHFRHYLPDAAQLACEQEVPTLRLLTRLQELVGIVLP